MTKFKLYKLKSDWSIENGTFVSSHDTKESAVAKMIEEAQKNVPQIYYWQTTKVDDKTEIYDYGSWSRFFAIREEDDKNA